MQEAIHLTETFQTNWSAKTLALLSIAIAQEKAGDAAEVEQRLEQAMNLFQKSVSDSPQEPWWSQAFVGALVKAGQLKKAADAAVIIKSKLVKPYALSMVAEAYGKAGDRVTAEKILEQALESSMNSNSMERIAVAYAQIGDARAALKTARNISGESDRSDALRRIADVQTQQGHAREALKWASALKSPSLKSSALLGGGSGNPSEIWYRARHQCVIVRPCIECDRPRGGKQDEKMCFVTLVCFTIALGIGLYDIIKIVNPEFTIAAYEFKRYQSNETFTRDWPKEKALPPDEELTKRRSEGYRFALEGERRDGMQGLTKVMLVMLIDIIVFFVHWRIARRERLVTTSG